MSLFWAVFASVVAGIVIWLAGQAERNFFADQSRVTEARTKIARQTWRAPLARVGAAAQLVGSTLLVAGMLAFLGAFIASGFAAQTTIAVQPSAVLSFILTAAALWLLSILVAVTAMLLCRCQACAGAVFDNSQAPRKTSIGYLRENWLLLQGKGRCLRCRAPFP